MRRALFFSLLLLLFPNLVASQVSTTRDSASTVRPSHRGRLVPHALPDYSARMAAENARMAAEAARLSAELIPPIFSEGIFELHSVLPQALAQIGPALEQMGPALEQAMREVEFSMQGLHHHLPELMALPPMPPMPALAPLPPLPPMPPLPPAPFYAMPHHLQYSFGDFFSKEYAENLTDDEQIKIQALAGLLSQDEKTALPEIKHLARQHPNWAMRAAAVSLLAGAESTEALAILDEALQQDADHRVRLAAVRALSNRSEPEAREILKRLLSK